MDRSGLFGGGHRMTPIHPEHLSEVPWNGRYDEAGRHVCVCGTHTQYQSFSGGQEFYCPGCKTDGSYPAGEGGPRARLLAEGPDGVASLRAQMDQEIARRKDEETRS